jgi:hypothetical protein
MTEKYDPEFFRRIVLLAAFVFRSTVVAPTHAIR